MEAPSMISKLLRDWDQCRSSMPSVNDHSKTNNESGTQEETQQKTLLRNKIMETTRTKFIHLLDQPEKAVFNQFFEIFFKSSKIEFLQKFQQGLAVQINDLPKVPNHFKQILEAEKNLFQALKKTKVKEGLTYQPSLASGKPHQKGKIARMLAAKGALTARLSSPPTLNPEKIQLIDYFTFPGFYGSNCHLNTNN